MDTFPLPLTSLIHENLALVMSYSLSRQRADSLLTDTFKGEWKYLRKVVYDISERQATKAMLELALFLRILDDNEGYSKREWREFSCGHVFFKDSSVIDLTPREVANKIIHAQGYSWTEDTRKDIELGPIFVCEGRSSEKWEKAEIQILSVAAICGQMMS